LCEEGLATTTTSGLSRRALVGTGGAAVGAGLLALSLPTAAVASSSLNLVGTSRLQIFEQGGGGLLDFFTTFPPGTAPFVVGPEDSSGNLTVSVAISDLTVKVNGSDLVVPFLAGLGERGLQWAIDLPDSVVFPGSIPNPVVLPAWWETDVTATFTVAGVDTPFLVPFPASRRTFRDDRP